MKSSSEVEAQNMKPSAKEKAQRVTPSPEKTTKKKAYNTPVLKVYGNVEALTKTAGAPSAVADMLGQFKTT